MTQVTEDPSPIRPSAAIGNQKMGWVNPDSSIWWMSPRVARILTPILMIFGVETWLVFGRGFYGHRHQPWILLGSFLAGFIPPIRRAFDWCWRRFEHPSARLQRWMAIGLAIGSSFFLYWTETYQKIAIHPKFQDEFSYMIQARMLAQGRLWMPAHACADFFDTFYLFVKPVYAPMYFPGAAMIYALPMIVHLPYVVAPLGAAGLCVGLLYLVICEALDGASALLAVLLLLAMGMFRMMSVMLMAQIPMLLMGLTMIWSVLHWRRSRRWGWLVLLGVAAGWGAITRPVDALSFAIALGCLMAMELRRASSMTWFKTLGIAIPAAMPFLAVQLLFNRNVTGHWFQTPFGLYTDLYYPGAFGFHTGPMPVHISDFPQKQFFYDSFAKGVIADHTLSRALTDTIPAEWTMISREAVVDPFFWLIFPMSLLAVWNRRLWAIWGMIPIVLILLSGYAFSAVLPHYVVICMPAMILLAILPIRFLADVYPNRTAMIRTQMGLAMIALALVSMPQFDRLIHDQYFETEELDRISASLSREVAAPAVVMFHYNLKTEIAGKWVTDNPSEEPVFNSDVAWPDDAPMIRANDLNRSVNDVGTRRDRNLPLYRYYLAGDPKRIFYLWDRGGGTGHLKRLGTARQMVDIVNLSDAKLIER